MTKQVTIWSFRHSVAQGNHQVAERKCAEDDALAWLSIFEADEPGICFVASARKPTSKRNG